MANPAWPFSTGIPKSLPIMAPEAPIDPRAGFQPDAGPGQVWAVTDAVAKTIQIPGDRWIYTSAEKATLETFIQVTLGMGQLPFDWTNPWPAAGVLTFRIAIGGWPQFVPIAPARTIGGVADQILYRVSMTLEWRPWYPPVAVTA